jgi:hypothetical protein
MAMNPGRRYRAGESIEDFCRACKTDRIHTVMVVDGAGIPIRVICDYCRSEHNFRGGPRIDSGGDMPTAPTSRDRRAPQSPGTSFPLVSDRERIAPAMAVDTTADLELLLRRVIREETGLTAVTPADKWRDGTLVLRPGTPGLQEKTWPIETFFHKIVMLRNRLRTLEQQLNASVLPDDVKVKLQGYVTGCYGSLTSFNVLFADEDDHFKGSGGE